MRFYELDRGRILLDGRDIAMMPRDELRSNIEWSSRHLVVRWDDPRQHRLRQSRATDAQIREAATATYVDRFVHSLPDGYDTVLGDEGASVSAGEKQLLTIARAFLANPTDPDPRRGDQLRRHRTEVLIQHAMAALRSDRTSFVIAHRLSTIRDADVILVMDSGRIVEQGTHASARRQAAHTTRCTATQFAGAAAEVG
jgi:ATP-binding cassette subfamily B protein